MGGRHRARRATHALAALALLAAGALLPATPAFANAAAPPAEAELWPRLAAQQSLAHIEHPRIALWERRWRSNLARSQIEALSSGQRSFLPRWLWWRLVLRHWCLRPSLAPVLLDK